MKVTIEREPNGTYIAYNTDGKKCILYGTGQTIEETKDDFLNTIEEVKQSFIDLNESIPDELVSPIHYTLSLDTPS